jgi:CRP-like cAMP-binding protein
MRRENIELNEATLEAMQACLLLQSLKAEQFDQVVRSARVRQLKGNRVLFEQGGALTDIYLLLSGGIKLQRLAPSGDEKVLEIIRPGQTFAEAVLFSGGSKYPVSAVTVSPSVVVCIEAEGYIKLLRSSNELCMSLLGKLSQRLHWMVNEVDRLTLHSATYRLVSYLLSHISEDKNDSTGVALVAPKHVIASRLSIKPETLSRTLKALSKQGLIRLDGSQIELVNVEKLRELITLDA